MAVTDLRGIGAFLGYMSGATEARHFNAVNIGTNGSIILHGTRPVVLASATPSIETRVNVVRQSATEAVVEITYRRWPDDSVNGVDQRLTLMFGEIGWVVNAAESRSLCSRGIDTSLNLCV